jgi:hypothetical protein
MLRPILFCLLFSTVAAAEQGLTDYGPLAGDYELVGRRPDSAVTYSGTVRLIASSSSLLIERKIGEHTSTGTGHFEYRTPDKIQVLSFFFKEEKQSFTSTCRVGWDLDNSARITCLYGIEGKTKSPGMEAFFIKHES